MALQINGQRRHSAREDDEAEEADIKPFTD
jgi:hypothetical protein